MVQCVTLVCDSVTGGAVHGIVAWQCDCMVVCGGGGNVWQCVALHWWVAMCVAVVAICDSGGDV